LTFKIIGLHFYKNFLIYLCCRGSSVVERMPEEHCVGGSIPSRGTKMYSVYVLYNPESKRIYIGYTNNLKRRISEHMKSNLSHRNKNFMLIFYESFIDKQDAIKRESYLKSSKGKISLRNILKNTLYRVGGSPRTT
jgi:putative endonuclease